MKSTLRLLMLTSAVIGGLLAAPLCASAQTAAPAPQQPQISITLTADSANPADPQMGDQISFDSVIANDGPGPVHGLVAWVSLVQIDPGHEQPVDLEDWSAHKAETAPVITPGQTVKADWPFRLIKDGTYRVVVSAATRDGQQLVASNMLTFTVRPKPVVESARVLPIAFGIPLLLGLAILFRRRRGARI